jgi:predicted tellurium resistance membrane protein TerC
MATQTPVIPAAPPSSAPPSTPATPEASSLSENQKRALLIGGAVALVVVIVGGIALAIWLVGQPAVAAAWRDVFIIFMALEFMVIGVALVVLIFQLAVLTNMLQHEIKPILDSANETINTVRGTTTFLSENLVEPVVKLNSYMAAIAQVVDSLGALGRFGRRKN